MHKITKIELDGNPGTGKTFKAEHLKIMFPECTIIDEGLYTAQVSDENFISPADMDNPDRLNAYIKAFRDSVIANADTLFLLLFCTTPKSKARLKERGDKEEDIPSTDDLFEYSKRFNFLYKITRDLPNVLAINTDHDIITDLVIHH